MQALLDKSFDTQTQLVDAFQSYASTQGFGLAVEHPNPNLNIRLRCDRGNPHLPIYSYGLGSGNEGKRPYRKKRRLAPFACPYSLYASRSTEGASEGKWQIETSYLAHTHSINRPGSDQEEAEQLSDYHIERIRIWIKSKIPPQKLPDLIGNVFPKVHITKKAISDIASQLQREELGAQELLEKLTPDTEVSEPAESTVRLVPAQPTVVIEPAKPAVRLEPARPMVVIEPVEPTVKIEQAKPTVVIEPVKASRAPRPFIKRKLPPKCSVCGTIGHNYRACGER